MPPTRPRTSSARTSRHCGHRTTTILPSGVATQTSRPTLAIPGDAVLGQVDLAEPAAAVPVESGRAGRARPTNSTAAGRRIAPRAPRRRRGTSRSPRRTPPPEHATARLLKQGELVLAGQRRERARRPPEQIQGRRRAHGHLAVGPTGSRVVGPQAAAGREHPDGVAVGHDAAYVAGRVGQWHVEVGDIARRVDPQRAVEPDDPRDAGAVDLQVDRCEARPRGGAHRDPRDDAVGGRIDAQQSASGPVSPPNCRSPAIAHTAPAPVATRASPRTGIRATTRPVAGSIRRICSRIRVRRPDGTEARRQRRHVRRPPR